jgi:hypothetical protein
LYFPRQDLSPMLRYPDQVVSNRRVGLSGLAHLQNILIHAIIIADENHTYI